MGSCVWRRSGSDCRRVRSRGAHDRPLAAPELTIETRLAADDVGVAGLAGQGYGGKVSGQLDGTLAVGSTKQMLRRQQPALRGQRRRPGRAAGQAGLAAGHGDAENGRLRLDPLQAHCRKGDRGSVTAGPFDENLPPTSISRLPASTSRPRHARTVSAGRLDGHLTGTLHGAPAARHPHPQPCRARRDHRRPAAATDRAAGNPDRRCRPRSTRTAARH